MSPAIDPHTDLEAVLACDTTDMATADAVGYLHRIRRLRGLLDRTEADITNRLNALSAEGSGAPAADVLTRTTQLSAREARRRERRARALANAASFSDALAAGTVAAEHADVLANTTMKLDDATRDEFFAHEATLLGHATNTTPEQFARHCNQLVDRIERGNGLARDERQRRDTSLSRRIDGDGMHHLSGVFHPELGARIFTALDHEVAALVAASDRDQCDRNQLAAQALANLISSGHQAERPGVAEVSVLIDERTAVTGQLHDHSICETDTGAALPPATIQRLLCDAIIHPIIRGSNGVVLNAGRDIRLANRHQRRALRAMYRTCAFAGCDQPFSKCEMHHIVPFEMGGLTDLANLLPVCAYHHHVVHERGWRLELDDDRTLTITQPDGVVYARTPIHHRPAPASSPPSRVARDRTDDRQPSHQTVMPLAI
jgi:hypothetical protein